MIRAGLLFESYDLSSSFENRHRRSGRQIVVRISSNKNIDKLIRRYAPAHAILDFLKKTRYDGG